MTDARRKSRFPEIEQLDFVACIEQLDLTLLVEPADLPRWRYSVRIKDLLLFRDGYYESVVGHANTIATAARTYCENISGRRVKIGARTIRLPLLVFDTDLFLAAVTATPEAASADTEPHTRMVVIKAPEVA